MVALLGYLALVPVVAKVAGMHGESSGNINIDLSFSAQYHSI